MKMNPLQTITIDALNDLKALDLLVLDVREITTLADTVIICSGTSTRHVKSLADNVIKEAKKNKVSYIKVEGEREAEWVIVDLADIIVHIMLPATREFYNLEELWEPIKAIREQQG
jgi:ribosome-associated protein